MLILPIARLFSHCRSQPCPTHLFNQYIYVQSPLHASCSAITTKSDAIFPLPLYGSFCFGSTRVIQNGSQEFDPELFTQSHTPYIVCSALLQKCSNETQMTFHRLQLMAALECSISHSSPYVFRWQSVSGELFVTKSFLCKTVRHRET